MIAAPKRLLALMLGAAIHLSSTACDDGTRCSNVTSWGEANHIHLQVTQPGSSNRSEYKISLESSRNDFYVESDTVDEGNRTAGKIGVVAGRYLLVSGMDLKPGYEIDAIDGPLIMMQLIMNVLHYAIPEGPAAIDERLEIDHREPETAIHVGTPSASGTFPAPWSVTGHVSPDQVGGIEYELLFVSSTGENPYTLELTGTLAQSEFSELMPDMALEGWVVHRIGPYSRASDGGTIYDYGAQPIEHTHTTVHDLRQAVSSEKITPNKSMESDT